MKSSDGFDARRLRPREPGNWRLRVAAMLAALFAAFGVLLAMAGAATLLGRPPALGALNDSPGAAGVLLALGLLLLWSGIVVWRKCRRRLRRPNDLSLAPHLMKKRN
jgi:membrane protein implicated in regulation of membrane protease activity